ncbi:MAG: hypothetical protein ACTHLA_13720 [Asticcacaulis sp.]|uniref:hypothetical protein n=1 Tax=Asticcacaulis sp. TaxID=1872648 RepID=UPI003F7CCB61
MAMYAGMTATPVISNVLTGKGLNIAALLIGIPVWMLAGTLFGVAMWLYTCWLKRKGKSKGFSAQ